MKTLIVVFILMLTIASCKRQAEKQPAPKINGIEFAKKYGFELPFLDYSSGSSVARGKKAKAEAVALSVFSDLTLTESGGVLTTSISPDAEWGGVQKFFTIDTTNNGVSVCNWNWSYVTAPSSQTCTSNGAGSYRSWTSDKVTYDIHLSPFLPL